MIQSQRHLFDIPDDIAYFNCSSMSPQLNESTHRLCEGVRSRNHPWTAKPESIYEDAETIRKLSQELFGGDADGYAIGHAASYGLNTAVRAIEPYLTKNDTILIPEAEFPSVVLSVKRTAQVTGSQLITVKAPEDGNWTQAIINQLDSDVKVLALSSCHWTNGAYIDLLKIRQACNEVDSILIIDATQTLGAVPCSMDTLKPDFLVAAGYKWLLSPYGFNLLYVDEKWRDERPLEESWLARANSSDYAKEIGYSDEYMEGARRFDVGEKCTPNILPGVIAALEQIKSWEISRIADSLAAINRKIINHLRELGFEVPDEKKSVPHIFGTKPPRHIKRDWINDLKERNIFISQRNKFLRFSPHLHINDHDIERLLNTITELVE